MLEEAIALYIDQLEIELGPDDDMIVKQLLLDATLIACRIQEERNDHTAFPPPDNDNA